MYACQFFIMVAESGAGAAGVSAIGASIAAELSILEAVVVSVVAFLFALSAQLVKASVATRAGRTISFIQIIFFLNITLSLKGEKK
jgi:hypothetical protein